LSKANLEDLQFAAPPAQAAAVLSSAATAFKKTTAATSADPSPAFDSRSPLTGIPPSLSHEEPDLTSLQPWSKLDWKLLLWNFHDVWKP